MSGAGGMLGEAFYEVFTSLEYEVCASDIDLNSDWLNFLDFRDLDAYKDAVLNFRPDYLFHLGAYTDLEYCEKNIDDTYSTNTLSVENAVQIVNSLQIPPYLLVQLVSMMVKKNFMTIGTHQILLELMLDQNI